MDKYEELQAVRFVIDGLEAEGTIVIAGGNGPYEIETIEPFMGRNFHIVNADQIKQVLWSPPKESK